MTEKWKRGLPPGPYYDGMVDDYEVSFAIAGGKWHRKRTPEERAAHIKARDANHAAARHPANGEYTP